VTALRPIVVDTGHDRTFLFVVVETDAGITGVGEGSQSGQDAAVVANIFQLAGSYVGSSPFELVERQALALKSYRAGRAMFVAVSAIEQALWDVMGKALDVPVYQLLGGAVREEVRCYATLVAGLPNWTEGPTVDAVVGEAVRSVEQGFDGVKVAPFIGIRRPSLDDHRVIARGVEMVAAVREAIGPGPQLLVEASYKLTRVEALAVGRALEPFACGWLESPLTTDDPDQLAALRAQLPVRIASGEGSHGRLEARPLVERSSVDVLQPDVKWCGGIYETKKIAAWAEAYQMEVACHNNSGPVATAASAHVSLTLPNALTLEVASRAPEWETELLRETGLVVAGGVTRDALSARPGLGIEFDEAVASRYALAR
jgi:galactonate dehydratase